jgi:short-subunit dehydrogenase
MFRLNLAGSRIIVTGASSGIGWALAEQLARHRARLVLSARSADKLEALAKELQGRGVEALAVPTDVADSRERRRLINQTVEAFGGIDILINNAGVGASGHFLDAGEERMRRILEVNLFAPVELTRLALPHLLKGRDAMVVNIGSVLGRRGLPGFAEYCASKFALAGWSESLRAELACHGVHVCLISPGLIATPFREHQIEDKLRARWQKLRAMSADKCARKIVGAMRWRWNELVITMDGKFLVLMNRLFPRFVDFLLARYLGTPEH